MFLSKNILKSHVILSQDGNTADRPIVLVKLLHSELGNCLAISLNLLSNELLVSHTLVDLLIGFSQLLLDLLLNETKVIHPVEHLIEILHHLIPTLLVFLSTGRHLLQQNVGLRLFDNNIIILFIIILMM